MALSPEQRTQLVKVLGMLGSAHVGERAAAAWMANKLVRDAGLMWDDVVATIHDPQPNGHSYTGSPFSQITWRDMVDLCQSRPGLLTPWEVDFLNNIKPRSSITLKQRERLEDIYDKCRRAPPGA